jgi:hypothetical protein
MTSFTAQWNNYPPQPDPSMTRTRAAKLLRAWRRNARKKSNSAQWTLKRNGLHSFTVFAPNYPNEIHTITWKGTQ